MLHNLTIDIIGILTATLNLFFQRRIIWACSILGGFYGVLMILFAALVIFAALLTAGDGSYAEYEWQVTKYSIIAVLLCFPVHLPVVRFIDFAASDEPRARLVFNFRVTRDDLISIALIHVCVLLTYGAMYLGYLWLGGEIVTSNWFTVLVLSPVISSLIIPLILSATTFAAHEPEGWRAARQWLSRGGPAMVTAYLLLSTLIAVVLMLSDGLIEEYLMRMESSVPEEALTGFAALCVWIVVLSVLGMFTLLIFPAGYRYWRSDRTFDEGNDA